MKRLFLLGIALNAAFFAGAQTSARNEKPVKQEASITQGLAFDNATHDFGTIEQGKPATVKFLFKNTSGKPLTLTQVQPSCGCTASNYTKEVIMPGESGFVSATYNAATKGSFTKSVTVSSSLGGEPVILMIKGVVGE